MSVVTRERPRVRPRGQLAHVRHGTPLYWVCNGHGVVAVGSTMERAYANWVVEMNVRGYVVEQHQWALRQHMEPWARRMVVEPKAPPEPRRWLRWQDGVLKWATRHDQLLEWLAWMALGAVGALLVGGR